jgi:hypothetical protein
MIYAADIHLVPQYDPITRTAVVDVVVTSDEPLRIVAADIAFAWDARALTLIGCSDERATVGSTLSGLPPASWDFYGANETLPPADGNGWAVWLSPLNGIPVVVEKAVLFSFVFEVHYKGEVKILPLLVEDYPLRSVVYGTDVPAYEVTGTLGSCVIRGTEARDGNLR